MKGNRAAVMKEIKRRKRRVETVEATTERTSC